MRLLGRNLLHAFYYFAVFCEVGVTLFAILHVLDFISHFVAGFYFLDLFDCVAGRYFFDRAPYRRRHLCDSDDRFLLA